MRKVFSVIFLVLVLTACDPIKTPDPFGKIIAKTYVPSWSSTTNIQCGDVGGIPINCPITTVYPECYQINLEDGAGLCVTKEKYEAFEVGEYFE